MKVGKQTLERWREAIAPLDMPELRARYIARDIPRHRPNMDIDVRYKFDLLWIAVDSGKITYSELDDYNSAHISTALGRIVPKLVAA
jgi:hypothetical protein